MLNSEPKSEIEHPKSANDRQDAWPTRSLRHAARRARAEGTSRVAGFGWADGSQRLCGKQVPPSPTLPVWVGQPPVADGSRRGHNARVAHIEA